MAKAQGLDPQGRAHPVPLSLSGRETGPRLPPLLNPALRGADGAEDPFLPAGYLTPLKTYEVDPLARGAGAAEQRHDAAADEIVVLELTDGSVFITSAARLQATLRETRPQLLGPDGAVLLEKLRVEGAQARGLLDEAAGGLLKKVTTLVVGRRDPVLADAAAMLDNPAELGISWLGTKALMAAIESRLTDPGPGLYRWLGGDSAGPALQPADFGNGSLPDPTRNPILVFIHGTASSTLGSFGDLHAGDPALWPALERRYSGGIYAFEHRTLSESPIENALQLAAALPAGAQVSLVSHSRGGLVADLLCLGDFDSLISNYAYHFAGTGDADPAEAQRVLGELETAHAGQRAQLQQLAALLREKRLQVQRYVRCASPAKGTRLASGNFDLFLSGILTLIGQAPFFFGSPLYSAFKRVVIEIARNRTNPHLVPGIEAMLPDAPMARLLRDAPLREPVQMALIAGDIEGGNLLRRLGVLLTDFLLFENVDNDLVVDTAAMLGGIASHATARVLFDRGPEVSHFRYFSNDETRTALRDWLAAEAPAQLALFQPLPLQFESLDAAGIKAERAAVRAAPLADLPVVVVLPGIMGSHLDAEGHDRIWFDLPDLIAGGLSRIEWARQGVEAEAVWERYYGGLCEHLAASHRVERFAYDWRQPLDVLGERLGEFLDALMKDTGQPVRLLAHSMGGLVVRACIRKRRGVMDALMQRSGARFIMLGTPNQGAWSMVENLLGKGSTLRTLIRLDLQHNMQQVLDIVAGFRGALALLPRPGFRDMFQGQPDGGGEYDLQSTATWAEFNSKVRDFWFGDHRSAMPRQDALDQAAWLWREDAAAGGPALPADYESRTVYVCGMAVNTACGVREESGRLKMVGTSRGDGTVSWESGRIPGIGSFYYMPAEHGDLPATREHFPALAELLASGATAALATQPPAVRAVLQPLPVVYDAGPPTADDAVTIERSVMGASLPTQVTPQPRRRLEVTVRAMDLRFLFEPIMVGHYEQDAIAGPESLIDRDLLQGDLSERRSLGLYAGPRGTVVVALRMPRDSMGSRNSLSGAVVTGLGPYDGALSLSELTESVRSGVLRYLLQIIDVLGEEERELPLATLLLGYNSSANLSVAASVEALVRGVLEANAKFQETTRLNIRVARLDIVELYLDTAITAVYALRQMTPALAAEAQRQGTLLVCNSALEQGEGVRQRLFDGRSQSYWPRLMITGIVRAQGLAERRADRKEDIAEPEIADRLRFLYIGQRARAESVVQQRQPGLVEMLVRQQIATPVWQDSFGRMLFQLMVPHDFKEAARQIERVVLVVDAYTANLPWELMLADDPARNDNEAQPLAVRTPVVRQFSTANFRRQVRQVLDHTALVVGNPSSAGFGAAFPGAAGAPGQQPAPLPGAEAEAEAVSATLSGLGYGVRSVIGADHDAADVLSELYSRAYRVLHVSGHGIYNLRHRDGRGRSGVVLSDGLLIGAAEIAAMEATPELVFLNCCHLGQVDAAARDGNRLAASVARELIDIGVRCVVVAGWAVNDDSARVFALAFYEQLFQKRRAFGDAVFEARRRVWNATPADITWGAFQAYGDPGWLADPQPDGVAPAEASGLYASPEELLDALASVRADLSRRTGRLSEREAQAQVQRVEQLLQTRTPPGWATLPALQSALGATWRNLGRFEKARQAYLAAIQAEDAAGRVPIRDIEQLANVEAHLGEDHAEQEFGQQPGAPGGPESAEQLLDLALMRLDGLERLVAAGASPQARAAPPSNAERSRLHGSVWKRKAGLYARQLLAAQRGGNGRRRQEIRGKAEAMAAALQNAVAAYRRGEGTPGDSRFMPDSALNRLALEALMPSDAGSREAAIALAQRCRQEAQERQARSPSLSGAMLRPEALLVESLIDGSLGQPGDTGQAAYDAIAHAYAETLAEVRLKPAQLDSIVSEMELLSLFCDALAMVRNDAALRRTAQRLLDLVQQVQPGRPRRAPPAVDAAAAKKTAPARRRSPSGKRERKQT